MSNQELSEAIAVAHNMTRGTSITEATYRLWVDHLKALLDIQKERARYNHDQAGR